MKRVGLLWTALRGTLALITLGGLILLPTLLVLSAVDQVWVPGIYDEADSDEALMAGISTLSTLDLAAPDMLALAPLLASWTVRLEVRRRAAAAAAVFSTRAPPIA